MAKKILAAFAATFLSAGLAVSASAGPLTLADHQMDGVTAGGSALIVATTNNANATGSFTIITAPNVGLAIATVNNITLTAANGNFTGTAAASAP